MVQAQLTVRPWGTSDVLAFTPSVEASPWGPLEGHADVLTGAHLVEFTKGRQHALIAARRLELTHGVRLDVVGLVSDGDRLQAHDLDAALHTVALQLGAHQLAMCTKHRHIINSCTRYGWQITGTVMTKGLHHVQQ